MNLMKTIIPNVKVGEIKTKPYQLKNIKEISESWANQLAIIITFTSSKGNAEDSG